MTQVTSISGKPLFGTLSLSVHSKAIESPTGSSPSAVVLKIPLRGVTSVMSSSRQGTGAHLSVVNVKDPSFLH
jgi:hypothetical protein